METLKGIVNVTSKIMHDPLMVDFVNVVQPVLSIVSIAFPPAALAVGIIKNTLSLLTGLQPIGLRLTKPDELKNLLNSLLEKTEYLNENVEWQSVLTQYHDEVATLRSVRDCLVAIAEAEDTTDEKEACIKNLEELINKESVDTYLNTLFGGLDKEEHDLMSSQILETFYKFSNGNRPQLERLSDELLNFLLSGITALYLCKKRKGETDMSKMTRKFELKLDKVKKSIENVLNLCKENFRENMESDIKSILLSKDANRKAAPKIAKDMMRKYDWLKIYCIVYNGKREDCVVPDVADNFLHVDAEGGPKEAFWQRNALVFFNDKQQYTGNNFGKCLDQCYTSQIIIETELPKYDPFYFYKMQTMYNAIETDLKESEIKHWGLVLIYIDNKQFTDVQSAGAAVEPQHVVQGNKGNYEVFILLTPD